MTDLRDQLADFGNEQRQRLHPNAIIPCPSESRRRTHLARGELCAACDPTVQWLRPCRFCGERVTVDGVTVRAHGVDDAGTGDEFDCPGSGQVVALPKRMRDVLVLPETAGAA